MPHTPEAEHEEKQDAPPNIEKSLLRRHQVVALNDAKN
jgi:hypothetical protein